MTARELALEFFDGAWRHGTDDSDPDAVITFALEPSPVWMWWARGRMGEALTREAACKAAEEALR